MQRCINRTRPRRMNVPYSFVGVVIFFLGGGGGREREKERERKRVRIVPVLGEKDRAS